VERGATLRRDVSRAGSSLALALGACTPLVLTPGGAAVEERPRPTPGCTLVASLRGSAGYNGKAAEVNEADVGIYLRNEAAARGAQAIVITSRRRGAAGDGDTLSQPRGASVTGGCPNCIAVTADAYRCPSVSAGATPASAAPSIRPAPSASAAPREAAAFSEAAAEAALAAASRSAHACVPEGTIANAAEVQIALTFATTGDVVFAEVTRGSFVGTPIGDCMARKFRNASVPPFSGEARSLTTSFKLGP
jgi:hypothetical protein